MTQLASAAGDGVAVKPGDAGQQGDAAAAMLAREKAGHKPARAFVRSRKEAVEGTMLSSHSALGVLSAPRAFTSVDDPPRMLGDRRLLLAQRLLLGQWTLTSLQACCQRGKVILFAHCRSNH